MMEFYLHNKDDRKSSTLVNLGTTFKIDDVNYIVYFNTQVEKSMIDIYIGKISYGDQCLVINKIDDDKQNNFLNIIKSVLAGNNPETELGDYDNIIDTATIVLETVQKIQIPTTSLDNLKNYHKNINDVSDNKEASDDSLKIENVTSDTKKVESKNDIEFKEDKTLSSNKETVNSASSVDNNQTVSSGLSFDDKLSSLNEALNERKEKEEKKANKKKKAISTPVLVLLIIAVIGSAILYFVGNGLE